MVTSFLPVPGKRGRFGVSSGMVAQMHVTMLVGCLRAKHRNSSRQAGFLAYGW
jgi:hypothetical protein